MKQSQIRMCEDNPKLICRLDTLRIHHAPGRRGQIRHAALRRAIDVVREWEEGVTGARHALEARAPLRPLLRRQRVHLALEQALPVCEFLPQELLSRYKQIYRVRTFGALNPASEGQSQNARVVPEPPEVCLGSREARAVDARLLTCAQTYDGPSQRIRDAVRLSVLECYRGNGEISERRVWELGCHSSASQQRGAS